jgi:hypothetical protein
MSKKKIIISLIILITIITLFFEFKLRYRSPIECESHTSNSYEFSTAKPEEQGISAGKLKELDEHIKDKHTYLKSFIRLRNGAIVFERYYGDNHVNTLNNVMSVTKVITGPRIIPHPMGKPHPLPRAIERLHP